MSSLFKDFSTSTLAEWKDQIIKDLRGKEHSVLEFDDDIENIQYKAYYDRSEVDTQNQQPGNYPYKRGVNQELNSWTNLELIIIEDETAANKAALNALMSGATGIVFKASKDKVNWKTTLASIQFEFIQAQFDVSSANDFEKITAIAGKGTNIRFSFDLLTNSASIELVEQLKQQQTAAFEVCSYSMQQGGANCSQEVAFALAAGHEVLVQLMDQGLSIDQAAACIHFNVGIGSNYFFEIAKFRTFRKLWAKVINAYNPQHSCSHNATITATTGFMNKSLTDPHTNLLRQTTEAMAAVLGGANHLMILPYDLQSKTGPSSLSARMARNISLILKEESYLDKVIDPMGGSYTEEILTDLIGNKAWTLFQSIESNGGILNDIISVQTAIESTRKNRIAKIRSGEQTFIGVNKFEALQPKESEWKEPTSYLGVSPLRLEVEFKNVKHA